MEIKEYADLNDIIAIDAQQVDVLQGKTIDKKFKLVELCQRQSEVLQGKVDKQEFVNMSGCILKSIYNNMASEYVVRLVEDNRIVYKGTKPVEAYLEAMKWQNDEEYLRKVFNDRYEGKEEFSGWTFDRFKEEFNPYQIYKDQQLIRSVKIKEGTD